MTDTGHLFALLEQRERAYLSLQAMTAIAEMIERLAGPGSHSSNVYAQVEAASDSLRLAVAMAFQELESVTKQLKAIVT